MGIKLSFLEPGMRVRLVNHHNNTFNKKAEWLGQIMTVHHFGKDDKGRPCVYMCEDMGDFRGGSGWPWYSGHIAEIIREDDPGADSVIQFLSEFTGG